MAKVISFRVELEGIRGAVTDGDSLAAAIKKTNEEFKKADFGSQKYKALQSQLGALKNIQSEQRAETRKQGREFEISADKGQRSYRALNAELVNARAAFKDLTEAQRNNDQIGGALVRQIQSIDKELKEIDQTIGLNQRNVGDYQQAFAGLAGIDLASFATIPGAIAATGAAAIEATQFVKGLVDEFRVLRGSVQDLTGATGDDLDEFTSRLSAISDTFGADVNEVLQSANALTEQLTGDFSESLNLIETGFVGNLDASGEFLDILKEYPTFFSEAGLSGDQFLNIINRQVDQGIFSDKGIDAVKEATLSLRELPKSAVDALAGIGISAEQVRKAIDEEGIGGAIELVSGRLGDFEDDSIEVATVIADVFKGAGEDAGVDFIKSLSDISASTDELIDKSNQYQQQQLETLRVNQEFARVQSELAESLGGASASFDNLGTVIQTKALQALLFIIDSFKETLGILDPIRVAVINFLQTLGFLNEQGEATGRSLAFLNGVLEGGKIVLGIFSAAISKAVEGLGFLIGKIVEGLEFLGILDEDARKAAEANKEIGKSSEESSQQVEKQTKAVKEGAKSFKDYENKVKAATVAVDKLAGNSIAGLSATLSKLKKEIDESEVIDEGLVSELIDTENALEKAKEARDKLRAELIRGEPVAILELLPTITPEGLDTLKTDSEKVLEANETVNRVVKEQSQELTEFLQEQAEIRAENIKNTTTELLSEIESALNAASAFSENRYEREIQSLEDRYEKEIELAQGNEAVQAQLEEELAAKREEIRKQEFNRQKKFRTAAAFASLAEGIINILSAPSTIPDPFGTIFKTIRIGVLTATTAAQVAKINAQRADKGAIVNGVARGRTHTDAGSGIPVTLNGQPFLIEHGESVQADEYGGISVINKRSTAAFSPWLDKYKDSTFPGKRQALSSINSYRGYGVKFAQEGALARPDVEALTNTSLSGTGQTIVKLELSDDQINRLAGANAQAVESGSMKGVILGSDQANRLAEREARRSERAGLI